MGGLPGNGPAVIQPLLSLSFVQQRNGALFSTEPLPFLNFAFVLFVIIIDPTTTTAPTPTTSNTHYATMDSRRYYLVRTRSNHSCSIVFLILVLVVP